MNTLKFYPEKLRNMYSKSIINAGIDKSPQEYHNSIFRIVLILTVISSIAFFIFSVNQLFTLLAFFFFNVFFYMRISIKSSTRIKKMELVFPDVISLMASNLRSGITIEKAFIMSARPEFAPLDKEILETGKEITTGKDVIFSLKKMSQRINSEKISKIVSLIISGLRAGGNVADLLEQTASNMKEKEVLEKKTASTTLMYVIFIFFAVAVGAPVLFGLSSVLVEIVITLAERVPDFSNTQAELPFTFQAVPISVNFIIWFSIAFLVVTDFLSSIIIGFVSKGDGKEGLKYFLPLVAINLSIFFIIRSVISKILLETISSV